MNQLRAELLKIRSTRTTIGLLLGLIALALLFTILTCTLSPMSQLLTEQDQSSLLSFGSIAGVFAALAGVMLFTSEYRFGTIRPTSLFNPNRTHLFATKITAGVLSGLVFGVIGFIAAFTVPGTYLRWAVGGLAASCLALAINLALAYAPEGYVPDHDPPPSWQPVPDRPAVSPPAH